MAQEMKVGAFMTAPRYESVWCRSIIQHALQKMGIPLAASGGVFYGQCMQRMLQDAIGKGIEVAITIDFDSVFTKEHVMRLLSDLATHPHIDAVAALQVKRQRPEPLFTPAEGVGEQVDGHTSITVTGEPFEVATAHFGLTAIRLDRLADIPRPWFHSQPDENGDWDNNKVDDDIWFWKRWREAGRTVYIDPSCSIGHMEEMIAVYGEDMQPKHVYPEQWRRDNTPEMLREAELCK